MWKQGTNKLKIQNHVFLWDEGKGEGNLKWIIRIYFFTLMVGTMVLVLSLCILGLFIAYIYFWIYDLFMINHFKGFLYSLKNISSTCPSVTPCGRANTLQVKWSTCLSWKKTAGPFSRRQGALHGRGLECQEMLGGVGPEHWAWESLAKPPEGKLHSGRGVLRAGKGPPGLPQSNSIGEQFRPRLRACLSFPGSHTTGHRKRDHVPSLQVDFLLPLAKEELKWGLRGCGISCTLRVMDS